MSPDYRFSHNLLYTIKEGHFPIKKIFSDYVWCETELNSLYSVYLYDDKKYYPEFSVEDSDDEQEVLNAKKKLDEYINNLASYEKEILVYSENKWVSDFYEKKYSLYFIDKEHLNSIDKIYKSVVLHFF